MSNLSFLPVIYIHGKNWLPLVMQVCSTKMATICYETKPNNHACRSYCNYLYRVLEFAEYLFSHFNTEGIKPMMHCLLNNCHITITQLYQSECNYFTTGLHIV